MEKSEFLKVLSQIYPDITQTSEYSLTCFYELYWSRRPKLEGHFAEIYRVLGEEAGYDYQGIRYTDRTTIKAQEMLISPEQCIGPSWLFDPNYSGNKPIPNKMARLTHAKAEDIPPVFVGRAGDYYHCTDGNHRIYAAYLFDRPLLVIVDHEFSTMTPLAS